MQKLNKQGGHLQDVDVEDGMRKRDGSWLGRCFLITFFSMRDFGV